MSIQDILRKFKRFCADDAFYYGTLMILMAVASFGLGRLSISQPAVGSQPASIVLSETAVERVDAEASNSGSVTDKGKYVGSVNSDKYHLPTCTGAGRIKEANQVWFESREAAEAAGYTPAGNCEEL
ncbi:MAG: hypothetical protein WDZ93_00260 [Candidatus Paceibacterota bacterium]